MGVDLANPGLAVNLLLVLAIPLAYAWLLVAWARRRGERFFWPGFGAGVIGYLGFALLVQYRTAWRLDAPFETDVFGRLLFYVGPSMILGPWFASRSVLRSVRASRLTPAGIAVVRAAGGFWGGLGLFLLLALLLDIVQGMTE